VKRASGQALAQLLASRAGDIVEFWDEMKGDIPELADVSAEEAATALGTWLSRLPGGVWDTRIPPPDVRA
jgi:hypothetical protein